MRSLGRRNDTTLQACTGFAPPRVRVDSLEPQALLDALMEPRGNRTPAIDHFVVTSPAMVEVLRQVHRYVRARTPLILVGRPGTGRTALSALIHAWSGRLGTFVDWTAGHVEPELEHSTIFGEGHPTSAGPVAHRRGLLEEAGEGTVALADFEDFRPSTQRRVLDAAGRGSFRPVRAEGDLPFHGRLILHLRETPEVLVQRAKLSEGVYHLLGYSVIRLPRLDERRADIAPLACRFLECCGRETGVPGPARFAPETLDVLEAALWPGELWQLRMVIREAYLRSNGATLLRVEHLSELVRFRLRFERRGSSVANVRAVRFALQLTQGRVREAARLLRTAPSTIYRYQADERTGTDSASGLPSDSLARIDQLDRLEAPPS